MQWAFFPFKLDTFGPNRALGQFIFGHICDPLKIIMASVTEMSGAETEKYRYRAAIATFIFKVVCPMFWAHLGTGHIGAPTAHKLFWVVIITLSGIGVTDSLTSEIGFATFKTNIVSVSF